MNIKSEKRVPMFIHCSLYCVLTLRLRIEICGHGWVCDAKILDWRVRASFFGRGCENGAIWRIEKIKLAMLLEHGKDRLKMSGICKEIAGKNKGSGSWWVLSRNKGQREHFRRNMENWVLKSCAAFYVIACFFRIRSLLFCLFSRFWKNLRLTR